MAALTGAWARRASTPTPIVPLVTERDPEHINPDPNIDVTVGMPLWVQVGPAPMLPAEMTGDAVGTPIGGGGPIDHTPADPNVGAAGGNGQTILEAQALRGVQHSQDYGAVAARHYQPAVDRDGAPHLAIIADTPGDGDSPQTLDLQRTGVGSPTDPYARIGKRIKRWYDRVIDMHRYQVALRPMPIRNAGVAQFQPSGGNTQYDSPWGTPSPMRASPDALVQRQVRRTPEDWSTPGADDGTAAQLVGNIGSFGLPSWGL